MPDLGLHAAMGFTAARLGKLGWAAMIGAAVGGMLPDIWSHIPNIPRFFSGETYTYAYYHLPHSVHGIMITAAVAAAIIWWSVVKESTGWFFFALLMLFGFALHVGIDELWHKPGGGWQSWGYWANVGGWVIVAALNTRWIYGIIRNSFSKGE